MSQINYIDKNFINQHTDYNQLIADLRAGFQKHDLQIPPRIHQDFSHKSGGEDSTLLLMPAWNKHGNAGVKVVTVNPHNHLLNLPSIQGTYILFDADTGILRAILDAKALTVKRTAAASALASSFLSRPRSSKMLMIGTGALAPELIKAHMAVRPIKTVYIWGRDQSKSQELANRLAHEDLLCKSVDKISDCIEEVDIICSATLSPTPLVLGRFLKPGQHVDLVGAYKQTSRESDNEVLLKSKIYVDVMESGLRESGDIFIPLQDGIILPSDIQGDLYDLCCKNVPGRENSEEITTFKSVGHAIEDLIAAAYYYSKYTK